MKQLQHVVAVMSAAVFLSNICAGAGEAGRAGRESRDPTGVQLRETIEHLRSDSFEEREKATRDLIKAGKRSIPAVTAAAVEKDLEVSIRAFSILSKLSLSEDDLTSRAAENTLETLAESQNRSVARRATDALRQLARARKQRAIRVRQQQGDLTAALRRMGASVGPWWETGEIKRVDFKGTRVTEEGLDYQKRMGSRDELSRHEFASKYVVRVRVTDGDLKLLKSLNKLESLNIQRTEVSDAGLEQLRGFAGLKYLVLSERITDAGLVHLAGLRKLEWLCLAQTEVTGTGFVHFKDLVNLKDLNLANTEVNDAGLAFLSGLSGLDSLKLGGTNVTDKGVVHLKDLRNLTLLSLMGTQITDRGLQYLAGLENLRTLNLDRTQVTDAGLRHLESLTNLKGVSFTRPLVTDEGVKRLRKALPNVGIHLWPNPNTHGR